MNREPRTHSVLRIPAAFIALLISAGALLGLDHANFISEYNGASTCLLCHRQATNVMSTIHWTWQHTDGPTGKTLGKRHVINNYCIALPSNEPRCTSCHIGVGYKDKNFNFSDSNAIDCLVCHDQTGTYKKFPTLAGAPWTGPGSTNFGGATWPAVDLVAVARSVGRPTRANCGACHFFGGGGDAVKHGDLDSSLYQPSRNLDVHMGGKQNLQCVDCHASPGLAGHEISGSYYSKDHADSQSCEKCHTATPHPIGTLGDRLNIHAARVGCQTCHIPAYARGRTTKMSWDWSTAGRKNASGQNYVLRDANNDPIYDTQKGNFVWDRDVWPEYVWFNGRVDYLTVEDLIDPTHVVPINRMYGDLNDPKARLMPVKRFTGRQPYDVVNQVLTVPHLFGSDTNAYWKSFNWTNALAAGMDYVGRTFGGQVGWVDTEMYWIQNHMVAPKEQALKCTDCHVPSGRLDFAALGYPAARAAQLQTLAGFVIDELRIAVGSGQVILGWTRGTGHTYQVQQSADLAKWSDAPNGLFPANATSAPLTWEDPVLPTGTRFYRILRTTP